MPLPALIVITILAHSAFNGSRVTISLYALSLGASPLTVGFFISLYSALPMFLGVVAGRMIDRVGMRRPLLVSTGVLVVAVALPGIVPTLYPLYVAAACIGTSFMVFHIAVQHMVGETSTDENRRNNFGWLALGLLIYFGYGLRHSTLGRQLRGQTPMSGTAAAVNADIVQEKIPAPLPVSATP